MHNSTVLNFDELDMDNFYTFHQERHSKKCCQQWINSMTLVMNQLLDTQLEDPEEQQAQTNEPVQKNKETTMVLWDWEPTLGLSGDEPTEASQVSSVNVTTRTKGLVVDEILLLHKIKKMKENMKKILSTTQTTLKPNPTDIKETILVGNKSIKKTINKPMETLENKIEATK